MGGSQSCFGGGGRDYEEYEQPWRSARKVRPSDEDGLWYVGERDGDRKATEFIARFHASASYGDFDFVARGGPWIFNKNALLVKEIKDDISPSEMILDAVPVWVQVYDVLWGKQNYETGMKFGNLLGRALEVDAPTEEKDMNEFLRVRVELPYDRRLQTQIATGVKGRTTAGKVYKLKYEWVPHYCAHCGFMGHRKFECEKKRRGVPSLDYNVYELRCSPYKKYEHRSHANPGVQSDQVPSHNYVSEQVGSRDGFEENVMPGLEEVNQTLSAQVEAMQVKPIVQLPEDGALDVELHLAATKPVIQEKVVKRAKKTRARKPGSKTLDTGLLPTSPGSSDMIPALHGLNSMVVSFGGSDETMLAVDQTPRKRSATETADKVKVEGVKQFGTTMSGKEPNQTSVRYNPGK
ncbi:hypothetical protein ACQ4PT_071133 [Festuca glaucescens]